MIIMRSIQLVTWALALALATGCVAPQGATRAEKIDYANRMSREAIDEMYELDPVTKQRMKQAIGYGAFSNFGAHVLFIGGENGYGVVVDKQTKQRIYMRMAGVTGGLGVGANDFLAVFLFYDRRTLRKFIDEGWELGGEADAAAKLGDKGGALGAARTVGKGMEIYQFTENGIALRATVGGTKYWPDADLN